MEFKLGDRVHVTRLNWDDVDFYATLEQANNTQLFYKLKNCSNSGYENKRVSKGHNGRYVENEDYYTLATEEGKGLKWSDGSSAEGTPIMCDEEDTEEPVIQRTTDTHDPVNKPSHYMLGDIEVKDIIAIVADKYHKGSVAHNVASALEYQMRAPGKNGLEDIKKARKCLDFAIENWE
ncbi:DUF3310 domain-containing protein [Mammaliicoccus sciuri]|uniref:DUF3310 domain-containing protein n=1 Tax=Mammaliicoccus sciuri TaxID=1296 RepID=UPI002DBA84DB|nr:DUF3310 domain-containing protein [Mammaliicoccus sciuri]MEB5757427.1 DUF3310 domain-containing protein [Mammaliicoccus sciuri]